LLTGSRWRSAATLWLLLACVGIRANAPAPIKTVRIGVLGLFHPSVLVVKAGRSGTLQIVTDAGISHVGTESDGKAVIRLVTDGMVVSNAGRIIRTRVLQVRSEQGGEIEFVLSVPGKIERKYSGVLTISATAKELLPVVNMELEKAVASIVASEIPAGAPLEALKAQAVAARSYLSAGRGRHGAAFDFCDTTHCQFLREPPKAGSPAFIAAEQTRGMVLNFEDAPFAAMYSASCGGRTFTLSQLGMKVKDYPYYSVECEYCQKNPEVWTRRITKADAALLESTLTGKQSEGSRIRLARELGWAAIPSNNHVSKEDGEDVLLQGTGRGHSLGLCQRGAAAMAREGKDFQSILQRFYPNTTLKQLR
jgi:stage II sporulation protein D